MSAKALERKEGVVREVLPGPLFRVQCDDGREILAHLAGRLRVHHIRILAGDRVILEIPAASITRGRIVYRK